MHLVINVDKPRGLTSRQAMTLAQKAFKARRAGHAGTLDPIATGVLLVCLGEGTKLSGFLSELDKEYVTTLKLGERTDTFDAEGSVVETVTDVSVTEAEVEAVLGRFRGDIEQVPPMYSALKVSGRPLYKLARKGIEVERKPRRVHVSELTLLRLEPPYLEVRIGCSKGTYVRTLADDIGRALGTGAHIAELRRTRVGHFRADEAALPEELPEKASAVHTLESALRHFGQLTLSSLEYSKAKNGTPFIRVAPELRTGRLLMLKEPSGRLFAVGVVEGKKIKVKRLLHII